MERYSRPKIDMYEILVADAVYQIQNNLLFNLRRIPRDYEDEREELVRLVRSGSKKSIELALELVQLKYKHCPAKGALIRLVRDF